MTSFDRRRFLQSATLATASLALPAGTFASGKANRTPVILATDIGGDIDDMWALGLLLKCPELDLKLVVTDFGNPRYRGKLAAKFLEVTGHGSVAVGLGPELTDALANDPTWMTQSAWVKDYELDHYKGPVYQDGVKALVDTIMNSPEPVTLIAVGPPPTVAAALAMEPRIATRARLVGMYGSVRVGYDGSSKPTAEANVHAAIQSAKQVLSAPWDITITPLDTCGLVTLEGLRYQRILKSKDPVASALIENYRLWCRSPKINSLTKINSGSAERHSSVHYDTVAVYLALSQTFCTMERLRIRVTDDGFTRIDEAGTAMNVATAWKDLEAYKDFLVDRLLGES